ncbi:hypothetical protein [Novosphingobium sp.]|uniref:hypothetical protein n=1 Tax=Novosphingobium sp. TaxID=1874826 RepID=UPI0031D86186
MPDHIQANQPDPAIRAYIKRLGGPEAFATKHNLSVRNAQRIYNGKRPCPNRLRDEIMAQMTLYRIEGIGPSPKILPRPIMAPGTVRQSGEITGMWIDELADEPIRSFEGPTLIWPQDVAKEGDHDQ